MLTVEKKGNMSMQNIPSVKEWLDRIPEFNIFIKVDSIQFIFIYMAPNHNNSCLKVR